MLTLHPMARARGGNRVIAAGLVCISALLAACSGDGTDEAGRPDRKDGSPTTSTAPPAVGTDAMCDLFLDIAAGAQAAGASPGDPNATFTPVQWDQKIATTAEIVDVVPPDHRAEAETYLVLVKARADLAAMHNYGVVPNDARQEFISQHGAQQQEVNKLLAFVRSSCNLARITQ